MADGLWRLTPQGIAFSSDGVLLDGQHRLAAIVECGKTIEMWVAYNVPPQVRAVIDIQRVRKEADRLVLGFGVQVSVIEVSAAKVMLAMSGTVRPCIDTLHQFVTMHREALKFAVEAFPAVKRGVYRAGVIAAIATAYYHTDRARLSQFCEAIYNGVCNNDSDSAAIATRDGLMGSKAPGGGQQQREDYLMTLRGIEAFVRYEPRSIIRPGKRAAFEVPVASTPNVRLAV